MADRLWRLARGLWWDGQTLTRSATAGHSATAGRSAFRGGDGLPHDFVALWTLGGRGHNVASMRSRDQLIAVMVAMMGSIACAIVIVITVNKFAEAVIDKSASPSPPPHANASKAKSTR